MNMKRTRRLAIIITAMVMMVVGAIPASFADEVGSQDLTMGTHTFTWLAASDEHSADFTIDGERASMTVAPSHYVSMVDQYVTAQVNFSKGGNDAIPAGKIEIRVPAHVYKDRDGNWFGNYTVGVKLAPEESPNTDFNYWIDEETDEIVLTNYREIPGGDYFFTCNIRYEDLNPLLIANGYENKNIQATFNINRDNGNDLTATSDALSAENHTKIQAPSGSKKATKYETWRSEWGEKPADADDYFYVFWQIAVQPTAASQAYDIYVTDPIEAPGKMLGWYYYRGYSPEYNLTPENYHSGTEEDLAKTNLLSEQTWEMPIGNGAQRVVTLVVQYPRDEVVADGGKVSNTAEIAFKGRDGDVERKNVSATYEYKPTDYTYTAGDLIQADKGGISDTSAAVTMLKMGKNVIEPGTWSITVNNRGYGHTDGGTKEYTTYLEDSYLYIDGERLEKGDYSFPSLLVSEISEYEGLKDPDKGLVESLLEPEETNPVELYVRTWDNDEWHKHGEITKTGRYQYHWSGEDGTEEELIGSTDSTRKVTLPEGTYAISLRHTGKAYSIKIYVRPFINYYSTDHMRELLEDKSAVIVNNVDTVYATDSEGVVFTRGSSDTRRIDDLSDVRAWDEETYGRRDNLWHDGDYHKLLSISPSSSMSKKASQKSNTGIVRMGYTVEQKDTVSLPFTAALKNTIVELVKENDLLNMHNEGIFYDLVPLGATVDSSTIRVRDSNGQSISDVTVEFRENWRGSGRTLMVVHARTKEGAENYRVNGNPSYMESRLTLYYDTVTPLVEIAANGKGYVNGAAYQSIGSELPTGLQDTGGTISDSAWLTDLDDSGEVGDSDKVFMYAEASGNYNVVPAAEFGFRKSVKSFDDSDYSSGTTTMGSGEYTYQLRFTNGVSEKTNNVVIYDVLETALPSADTAHWTGTFQSVDVSKATQKGIDVKVYYSTSKAFSNMSSATNFTDLTNTDLWTTEEPADPSTVTAVAIDLRKDTDGEDYWFEKQESVACYVHMSAPGEVEEYLDNPDTTDVDETVFAYNNAYMTGSTESTQNDSPKVEPSNDVKVSLREPNVNFDKASSPESGTKDKPTKVAVADDLTYTLTIENKEQANALRNVVIEDTISDHLSIDTENITYYFGSWESSSQKISESDDVSVEQDGNQLIFTVKTFAARDTLHISIPTTVGASAAAGVSIENTAKITKSNGADLEIESDTTYHKTNRTVVVKKVWTDEENAYQTRPESIDVQLYADGDAMEGKTATLSDENEWQASFTDLERYQADGKTEVEYTVKEMSVPKGYTASYIEEGLTVVNTAKFEDLGSTTFVIQKYRTGTIIPVEGAVFELIDANGTVVDTMVTDESGVATAYLTPSEVNETETYTLTETEAPSGYIKSDETWRVVVTRGDHPTVTINENKNVFERLWSWTVGVFGDSEGLDESSTVDYVDGVLTVTNDYVEQKEPEAGPLVDEEDEGDLDADVDSDIDSNDVVDTSDSSHLMLWTILVAVSVVALVVMVQMKRKSRIR